jgi:Ca2+-binding EF-hand superfamily protein
MQMGIGMTIIKIAAKAIKIKKDTLLKIVNEADVDGDGYIDMGEVFYFMDNRGAGIKEKKV